LPLLENPSLDALLYARQALPRHHPLQAFLAPYDHQAFASEMVKNNPWLYGTLMPFMVPAYQGYKAIAQSLGYEQDATPPSYEQLIGGYRGWQEGLLGNAFQGSGGW